MRYLIGKVLRSSGGLTKPPCTGSNATASRRLAAVQAHRLRHAGSALVLMLALALGLGSSAPVHAQLFGDDILVAHGNGGTNGAAAIFVVDPVTGEHTVVRDFGIGDNPGIVDPFELAIEADGHILVGDRFNGVFRLNPQTGGTTQLTGGGGTLLGFDLDVNGDLIVWEVQTFEVLPVSRIDPVTLERTIIGQSGDVIPFPRSLAVEADGNILLGTVETFIGGGTFNGSLVRMDGTTGDTSVLFDQTGSFGGLAVDTDGTVVASNGLRNLVLRLDVQSRQLIESWPVINAHSVAIESDRQLLTLMRGTPGGELLRINPVTGAITVLAQFNEFASSVSHAVEVVPELCGNAIVGVGETCDDGNLENGDGCSAICQMPPVALCRDVAVAADASCQGIASIDNMSFDPDGEILSLMQNPDNPYALGITPVTLTVTDDRGESDSCQATVTVSDDSPPTVTCPLSQVLECTGGSALATFAASAVDNCSTAPTTSCDPPSGTAFALGETPVTCTAEDTTGNQSSQCGFTVSVVDTTAPTISSTSASPSQLWPPNHRMKTVTVAVQAEDGCDSTAPSCAITAISSNEPVDGPDDGSTVPDWEITGALTAALRAERSGSGSGRVYTIETTCTDAAGNAATSTALVQVPLEL